MLLACQCQVSQHCSAQGLSSVSVLQCRESSSHFQQQNQNQDCLCGAPHTQQRILKDSAHSTTLPSLVHAGSAVAYGDAPASDRSQGWDSAGKAVLVDRRYVYQLQVPRVTKQLPCG